MALEVFIDGFDITEISLEGSWTQRLNRPWEATVRVPVSLRESFMTAGSKLKIVLDDEIMFHGFIQMAETVFDQNVGYCTYTAMDIMELWRWRPVRDVDGDYSDPTLLQDFGGPGGAGTGGAPIVIEQMLLNSVTAVASADLGVPDGTLFLEMGQFPLGGVDVSGAPTDWPMTMMELAALLCSTGELDIVLTPLDSGGNMARVDTYHGDYGDDRSSEIIFEYGQGGNYHNIQSFNHVEDFSNVINKLRYLFGSRLDQQHWQGSVDGGPLMPDPPLSDVLQKMELSRNQYGGRFDIRIFGHSPTEIEFREFFERLWFQEAWLRSSPRTLVHFQPTRDTEINTFKAGDVIGVNLYGTAFPGGVFGQQRVYGYTISWDTDSVLSLSELQTSADQEDFPS